MVNFLQINLNHCRQAQDLLAQTVAEERVDVVIASDPHGLKHEAGGWLTSEGGNGAAIGVFGRGVTVSNVIRDEEFVSARLGGTTQVYSCYVSPRYTLVQFQSFLQRLEASIRGLSDGAEVIIAGDFNARSAAWGDWETCSKGTELAAFADSFELMILNEGSEPTFVGRGAGSIVDVTLASESLSGRVRGWRVKTDENYSDHNSITFQVDKQAGEAEGEQPRLPQRSWDTTKGVNLEDFMVGLLLARWVRPDPHVPSPTPDQLADSFERVVSDACNYALPARSESRFKPPVPWWNEEIAEGRRNCTKKRRALKRAVARTTPTSGPSGTEQHEKARTEYKEAKYVLKKSIRKSKSECWRDLIQSVDSDPWGKPYKVVMNKLKGPAPVMQMEKETVERIIEGLFPSRDTDVGEPVVCMEAQQPFTHAELEKAVEKIKPRKKAPGPDGINTTILVAVYRCAPNWILDLFNTCIQAGTFPKKWKHARLVLLRKGDKPIGEPASYRPLCLLNDIGKLLESLLTSRLEVHMETQGGLSSNQFGFRRGLSTDDAVIMLKNTARTAVNRYETCVAVSLDIKNAFNSIGWNYVATTLAEWDVPAYLQKILQSYFHERNAEIDCPGGKILFPITCGVPQGSVVGPMLWNLTYDAVLQTETPPETKIIGFADDTLVIAKGRTTDEVEKNINDALDLVVGKIRGLELDIAVHKTEAVMFKRKYKDRVPDIEIEGNRIGTKKCMKYLGIIVDEDLKFTEHIKTAAAKAQGVIGSLSRLMPNLGGPKELRRKLLVSVVHSILLYGAPVWAETLEYSKTNLEELARVQRRAVLRSICAYRTVSRVAANILAAIPPIDYLAWERMEAHIQRRADDRDVAQASTTSRRAITLQHWSRKINTEANGGWTRTLIQDLPYWCKRDHGQLSFHLTQMLSGHGCFGKYLCFIRKEPSPRCHHCEAAEDNAEHTMFHCSRWVVEREAVNQVLGEFLPGTAVQKMVSNRKCWDAVAAFASIVLLQKEDAERLRRGEGVRGGNL